MRDKIQNWLVIGIPQNWETALSQPVPIWGLKLRYQVDFQSINIGDILWLYSTSPISGVIGVGVVKDKYVDNINLIWQEEKKKREVIWPLRFRIHILKVLPKSYWKRDAIKISDFNLLWQVGFQLLKPKHVVELFKRAKKMFGIFDEKTIFYGSTIVQPDLLIRDKPETFTSQITKLTFSHKELQEQIAEIGKLQFYYTETEYPLNLPGERKNLDVVWKREVDGVPTFAFEVELSGMIEKAIERLKFSFRKFNSRPRVIVPREVFKKVHNVLSTTDQDFCEQIRIYEPKQIIDLLNRKRALKKLEQDLQLY